MTVIAESSFFRACTLVGHFWMSCCLWIEAVLVTEITDKAGMVKPIDFFLAFLSGVRQLFSEILLPGPEPHLGALFCCFLFLGRVCEAEQLENTFNGRLFCCHPGRYRVLQNAVGAQEDRGGPSLLTRICGSRPRTRP